MTKRGVLKSIPKIFLEFSYFFTLCDMICMFKLPSTTVVCMVNCQNNFVLHHISIILLQILFFDQSLLQFFISSFKIRFSQILKHANEI